MEYKIKENKIIWTCPVCGYVEEGILDDPRKLEQGIKIEAKENIGTGVIEEKYTFGALTELVSCPKCGHSPVEYTSLQTRAADEPPVRLYRCPKCGYTWREY